MVDEDRFVNIETKLAFQEELVQTLNDAIVQQLHRLSALEERYQTLFDRVASLAATTGAEVERDEQPPHY